MKLNYITSSYLGLFRSSRPEPSIFKNHLQLIALFKVIDSFFCMFCIFIIIFSYVLFYNEIIIIVIITNIIIIVIIIIIIIITTKPRTVIITVNKNQIYSIYSMFVFLASFRRTLPSFSVYTINSMT